MANRRPNVPEIAGHIAISLDEPIKKGDMWAALGSSCVSHLVDIQHFGKSIKETFKANMSTFDSWTIYRPSALDVRPKSEGNKNFAMALPLP